MLAPISCLEVESMATEYAEGLLGEAETRLIDEHLAECATCRAAMDDMRQALALCRKIDGTMVPAGLVQRILDQTTGKISPGGRLRMWLRPVREPRVALSLAAALVFFTMFVRTTGMDVSQVRLADLSPGHLYAALDRSAHLAYSRAVKYYQDLKVVYQIQTQLQAIREATAPPADTKPKAPPQKPAQPGPAQLNKWLRPSVYIAAWDS